MKPHLEGRRGGDYDDQTIDHDVVEYNDDDNDDDDAAADLPREKLLALLQRCHARRILASRRHCALLEVFHQLGRLVTVARFEYNIFFGGFASAWNMDCITLRLAITSIKV